MFITICLTGSTQNGRGGSFFENTLINNNMQQLLKQTSVPVLNWQLTE